MVKRAAAVALCAVLAACSPDVDPTQPAAPSPTPTPSETADGVTEESGTEDPTAPGDRSRVDGQLVIGTVLPVTGLLSFLAAPQVTAVDLAITDLNAAGGVLGSPVVLVPGDSETDGAAARATVRAAAGLGADAIIGPASSTVARELLPDAAELPVGVCSASNTSPGLTDLPTATTYLRTVPPDHTVGGVLADVLVADGWTSVVIVRDDSAATLATATALSDSLPPAQLEVRATVAHDRGTSVADTVDAVLAARSPQDGPQDGGQDGEEQPAPPSPAAVVLLGPAVSPTLLTGLLDAGIAGTAVYGPDSMLRPGLAADADRPLTGVTAVAVGGDTAFSERLDAALAEIGEEGNLLYGAQAYDCVMVLALAAHAAGTDDPRLFLTRVTDVTSGGEVCTDVAVCIELLDDGVDIDYDGVAGPLAIDSDGEPTSGRYTIVTYGQDGRPRARGHTDVTPPTAG